MIKQIEELLSRVQINITKDVNNTEISFSFKVKEQQFPPNWSENFGNPPDPLSCDFCENKGQTCANGREADKCRFYVKHEYDTKGNIVKPKTEKEKTVEKLKEIVKESGIPKDKVIIGSIPKKEIEDTGTKPGFVEKRMALEKESLAPPVLDLGIEPIEKVSAKDIELQKRFKEREKRLLEFGHVLNKDKNEFIYGGVGITVSYVEKCDDAEFNRAFEQLEVIKTKHQARMKKLQEDDSITHQVGGSISGNATVTGTLTEQEEMMEQEYAVSTKDDNRYQGKPATPEEAFDVPEKSSTPPPPPITDMYLVASNPMEQMKKNAGKPYLNKSGVLITPDVEEVIEDELSAGELWDLLVDKCKKNDISIDGMTMDDQSKEEIEQLIKWVDETIAEQQAT
jgi:hypothetical protein